MNQPNMSHEAKRLLDLPPSMIKPPAATSGMLQEVFNLDEGPVTLTFPAQMSTTSYMDLADYFQLFLRKAKRQSNLSATEALKGALKEIPDEDEK